MKREEAVQRLSAQRELLAKKFGVTSLAIFGSTARDEAEANSDIDVLVEFGRPTGLFARATRAARSCTPTTSRRR